jgi:hypothetical protein
VERRLTLGNLCVGRAGAVPLATQGPSDAGFGWAASRSSASRVPLSSNGTSTSHGLYKCKLEIVVIVDSRMLDLHSLLFNKSYLV